MTDGGSWKLADRAQLLQIISGLEDGVIIVEPDQTLAWANRAALAMHGVHRLEELGRTVDEYRSRFELRTRGGHKLPDGRSAMDRVMRGEGFTQITVTVGRPGQEPRWTHQIRCLALTDGQGRPDCLALILNDATERYGAEERFERTFAANPAPAIICRLSDLRYVKVNDGFLSMTGYRRDELLGRSAYDFDVLEQAEGRDRAVAHLRQGQTIRQREARLRVAGGRRKFVVVAGHPIEVGDTKCMLFSFVDLDERKQAEDALRDSEARFAATFALAPVPMAIIDPDGFHLLGVNQAFVAATGWKETEVLGRSVEDLKLWEDDEARRTAELRLRRNGTLRNIEFQLRTKGGTLADHLLSSEAVLINGKPCVLSVMQDISGRKRTEAELMAAIEAVMKDTSWFGQRVVEKLASLAHPDRAAPSDTGAGPGLVDLSRREREVLCLIARGAADQEIADKLGVSRNTVRNHVSKVYRKIGVRQRGAAVVWARERGMAGDGQPSGRTRERGSADVTPG